jgi:1-acyl-sn-glycerol-3-phosphate acyltransferase
MLLGLIALLSIAASAALCAAGDAFAGWAWTYLLPLYFAGCFLALIVAVFLVLLISCALVDLSKPQKKENRYYRFLVKLIPAAVLRILFVRMHTRGLEQLPKDGRFLLVCNHINDLDPVVLLKHFPKSQLAFITKRENMKMFVVGKIMHKIMCQPVNRENDREALKTILKCIELIREDQASVAVFPEGYTSRDGKLQHFRHGVFKIAQKTKVPVVVCTVRNTNKVFRNIAKLKATDVHLHLLTVIQPQEYEGLTAVELGEKVYDLMAEDLGPELVRPAEQNT